MSHSKRIYESHFVLYNSNFYLFIAHRVTVCVSKRFESSRHCIIKVILLLLVSVKIDRSYKHILDQLVASQTHRCVLILKNDIECRFYIMMT